jgi:hypothetical protein
MIELLAVLSISAAVGLRIALPLLLIFLLYGDSLWSRVPFLSHLSPQLVLGVLVSWSLAELIFSKDRLGSRILYLLQLIVSPLVGTLIGIAVASWAGVTGWLIGILGAIGGLLALVLQLVQLGWLYRLHRIPLWAIFLQDALCILLVLFALDAPRQGGLIALLLLWLAIRSSKDWRRWYAG